MAFCGLFYCDRRSLAYWFDIVYAGQRPAVRSTLVGDQRERASEFDIANVEQHS